MLSIVLIRSGQQTPVLGAQPSHQSSAPPSLPSGYGSNAKAPTPPSSQFSFKATAYLLFDDIPNKDKLLAKVAELNADKTVDVDAISDLLQVQPPHWTHCCNTYKYILFFFRCLATARVTTSPQWK